MIKRNGYSVLNSTALTAQGGNDSNVKLMLHCNGTDTSTTITDSETTPKTATARGTAQIDTAQFVFGNASLLLDGNSDYVDLADSADWDLAGTGGAFTIDLRVRWASVAADSCFVSHVQDADNFWKFWWDQAAGQIKFDLEEANVATISIAETFSPSVDTWYHIELVRDTDSKHYVFVNGTKVGTEDTDTTAIPALTGDLDIGAFDADGNGTPDTDWHNGWLDEIRISLIARHTADFTVPTRPYDTLVNGTALQITSLHWFEISDGTKKLMCTAGTGVYKMDDLDGTWDDIGVDILTDGNLVDWVTYRDVAIGTDNGKVPIKWTGSGSSVALSGIAGGGVAPTINKSKWVNIFAGYTFLANMTSSSTLASSRVMWSTVGTVETWDAADFVDVDRDNGEEITGIEPLGDRLVIFKTGSIHIAIATGDADIPFYFTKTPADTGCISGYSIQRIDNGLQFLSEDGYYYFDGNSAFKISDRITTTLNTFEKNQYSKSVSCYQVSKNRYWGAFTLSGATTNSRAITFDSYNNAFSYYKGHNISAITIARVSGNERVYFGDYSGYVYRADTGTNDSPLNVSTAIDFYFYTKWHDFGDLALQKQVPQCVVYYRIASTTVTFAYSYDLDRTDQYTLSFSTSTSASVYGTATYGDGTYAAAGGNIRRIDLTGRGRLVRIKFANATLSETVQIDGYALNPSIDAMV